MKISIEVIDPPPLHHFLHHSWGPELTEVTVTHTVPVLAPARRSVVPREGQQGRGLIDLSQLCLFPTVGPRASF